MPGNNEPLCKLGTGYLEYIHDQLIEKIWPGSESVREDEYRSTDLLDSAANRPFQTAFGTELYPTVIAKSAALFHAIIANHPFHNGNKRAAVIAFDNFLLANGHLSVLGNTPMYDLAKLTASYRQRNVSHERSMAEVMEPVQEFIVTFEILEREFGQPTNSSEQRNFVARVKQIRIGIRANPLNSILR